MAKIIKQNGIEPQKGHCGDVIRLLAEQNKPANFDRVRIYNALEHLHKLSTEYYYVLVGRGHMILDNKKYLIEEGDLIEILPNTWHKAVPESELEVLVIGIPPLKQEDTYYR